MIRLHLLTFFKMIVFTALTANADHAEANQDDELAGLIRERLSYMKDVAAYKWLNQRPIEDLEREATVLAAAQRDGLDYNITKASSHRFFLSQINAAKEIQSFWFEQWRDDEGPKGAKDLITEVRPQLLQLGTQITARLKPGIIVDGNALIVEGLSSETALGLAAAARDIEHYEHVLGRVLDSSLLRVGTTGDYQPFSYPNEESSAVIGIDIDLARDLATSLGVEVEFVSTSWPTLMADFAAGRFDIGMSGISINLARQRSAFFSDAYHTGGKAAIGRCADVARLNSLDKIDSKRVRLVVNPGGTNQRFVTENIKKAKVRVHPDNRTIFQEIIEDRADVMITDAIEVRVKANRHPELCATLGNSTLSFQEKGYLLPQDVIWQQYVNAWLTQRRGDDTLQATFIRHGAN